MKIINKCWSISLIVVNVSIASLGIIQIGLAVSLRHTLDSSSDVLKYERKMETILMACAGLLSFIIGFYGICISFMYVTFFLKLYILMLIIAICVQVPICFITIYSFRGEIISERLFQDSNRMIRNNKPPEGLIFLQKNLYCCGFEGFSDYKTLPSSCCKNQVTCEFAAGDLYRTGCKRAMGNYLEPFIIVLGALVIHHMVFDIIGVVGATCQIHQIKKQIEARKVLHPEPKDQFSEFSKKGAPSSTESRTRNTVRSQYLTRNKLMSGFPSSPSLQAATGKRPHKDLIGRHDRNPSNEWVDEEVKGKPRYKGTSIKTQKHPDREKSKNIESVFDDTVEDYIKEIDIAEILNTSTTFREENVKSSSLREKRSSFNIKDRSQSRSVRDEKTLNASNSERVTKQSTDTNKKEAFPSSFTKMKTTTKNSGTVNNESISQKNSIAFTPSVVAPPKPHDENSQTAFPKTHKSTEKSVQQPIGNPTNPNATSQKRIQSPDVNKLPVVTISSVGSSRKTSGSPIDKKSNQTNTERGNPSSSFGRSPITKTQASIPIAERKKTSKR